MLDLVPQQSDIDWAVLELSSFQLEYNTNFAPDVAVWTNFYPNHLDRHRTEKNYFDAKWRLFAQQNNTQHGIFSLELFSSKYGDWLREKLRSYHGSITIFHDQPIDDNEKAKLLGIKAATIFFIKNGFVVKGSIQQSKLVSTTQICSLASIPRTGFLKNWLAVVAVLAVLRKEVQTLTPSHHADNEHRMELFLQKHGVDFYNDSKATVMEATKAAVEKLACTQRPIIVVLGGLGKGVDRGALVVFLSKTPLVKKVLCLGVDDPTFSCYERYPSLHDLVRAIMQAATVGDQVLFSPSGSSFDLFKNYKERGTLFKQALLSAD